MRSRWGMTGTLRWIALGQALRGFALGLYITIWPLWVEKLGGNAVALGFLGTVGGATTALVLVPGGWLSDRAHRGKVLLWGAVASLPAPFVFALAPTWWALLPGVIIFYGAQFSRPALQAAIAEEAPKAKLATAFSLVMSAFDAGMVLAPPLGALIASHLGYRLLFVLSGAISLPAAACYLPARNLRATSPSSSVGRRLMPAPRPAYLRWLVFVGVFAGLEGLATPFVVPYWKAVGHLSLANIGWLGSVSTFAGAVSGPLFGRLVDRVGAARTLALGLGCIWAGWTVFLFNPASFPLNMIGAALRGVDDGCQTVAGAAVGRLVPSNETGTAFGFLNLLNDAGRAVAPLPGGLLYTLRPRGPFIVTAFLTGCLGWWFLDVRAAPPASPPRKPA